MNFSKIDIMFVCICLILYRPEKWTILNSSSISSLKDCNIRNSDHWIQISFTNKKDPTNLQYLLVITKELLKCLIVQKSILIVDCCFLFKHVFSKGSCIFCDLNFKNWWVTMIFLNTTVGFHNEEKQFHFHSKLWF
jgi:hypothetical protein